ncbi:putative oligosaccharyltransferase complex subunit cg9662 [Phtheirospermum japonicum]|uniref:Putative oligosaccharyltransferase complex subunit cg9662 n=1 Tax=Phtheirospermum japonicum TaxID=374723 RepID=A0A830CN69_9LAMI|nr:putative oligosaccharyltransferase complex subunit cg9662 [Phtheirospermum japonicum]
MPLSPSNPNSHPPSPSLPLPRKTTRTKIPIVQIHPRTPAKMSTTSSHAASQNDPSSGSIDPIFHLVRTFPFSFLCPPRLHHKLRSFTLPSPMTVYSIILLTYFMVISGIVYDVIVEPPGIGSMQDRFTRSVKPVVFLPDWVHGQYIIVGLSSRFMFVLGSDGIMLLDLALDKNWAKSLKINAKAPEFVPRSSGSFAAAPPPPSSLLRHVYMRSPLLSFVPPFPPPYYGYEDYYRYEEEWVSGCSSENYQSAIQKLLRRILEDTKDASESFRLLGLGHYLTSIMKTEKEIKEMAKKINDLCGIKESDTSLAVPSQWDLVSDKQMMQEKSLQVYEDNKSKHLGCQGCQSGVRSVHTTIDLLGAEFKNVHNMGGGYIAWVGNAFEVTKPPPSFR